MATAHLAPPARLPGHIRWLLAGVLVASTIFARFGLNLGLGDYSLDFCLIAEYVAFAALLGQRLMRPDPFRMVLYLAAAAGAVLSTIFNPGTSPTSLLLFLVLYLPFAFLIDEETCGQDDWVFVRKIFLNLCAICAFAGILQFFLQKVIHQPWVIDYRYLLPDLVRSKGIFNTAIPVGSFLKSNGFFLREPSDFSQFMAFGILLEIYSERRPLRLALLGFGLLVAYSGTGLIALVIGAMFPLGAKTIVRFGALAAAGAFVFFVLGDALQLTATAGRISEFSNRDTSAYIRFIAPFELLGEGTWGDALGWVFGLGPGSISRTIRDYGFFDPTWAKSLYEYGVVGFIAAAGLYGLSIRCRWAPVQLRAAFVTAWLILGGNLLGAPLLSQTFTLLSLWTGASRVSDRPAVPISRRSPASSL